MHSPVGVLPLALQYGMGPLREFLAGAHSIDRHFASAPLERIEERLALPRAARLHILAHELERQAQRRAGQRVGEAAFLLCTEWRTERDAGAHSAAMGAIPEKQVGHFRSLTPPARPSAPPAERMTCSARPRKLLRRAQSRNVVL